MAGVVLPSGFDQRVLGQEAPGGPPASVSLVLPTITAPGRPFDIRLAVRDGNALPSVCCGEVVTVRMSAGLAPVAETTFEKGRPAVCRITGATIDAEGLYRFEAELNGETFHSNPTLCTSEQRDNIYWGDPHVHTSLSNCHPHKARSPNFCYVAARHLAGLDWVAGADHVSNGRCELARWKAQCAACNAFDDPPAFATLPAYEASLKGGCGGDNNVYMLRHPALFVDEYDGGNVKTICEKLAAELNPGEFFVVPHHTTRTGKHGEIPDEIYPGPGLMPVIEIHSKWGTSEYRGNPNPLHQIHPGPSYAADMLGRGLRLGFIGGTDTHATIPANPGPDADNIDRLAGMTAIRANMLSRAAIFDAIKNRRCYATSLERILLDGTAAGAEFGALLQWDGPARPREIDVLAAAKSDIVRIDLVRNGETIHSVEPRRWHGSLTWADGDDLGDLWLSSPHLGRFVYYYVRVTCTSGAQAWSSPAWLIARES